MKPILTITAALVIALAVLGVAYWLLTTEGPEGLQPAIEEAAPPEVEPPPVERVAPVQPPPPPPVPMRPDPPPAPSVPDEPARTLSQQDIENMAVQRQANVRACYDLARIQEPQLFGSIQARITIGADGRVHDVTFPVNTVRNPVLEECLLNEILSWQFERTESDFTGSYTFTFSR